MFDLKSLAKKDPQKLKELAIFHWFTRALKINYEDGYLSERPDFIMQVNSKIIGVEITEAERKIGHKKFTIYQIEEAQKQFARRLKKLVNPLLPIEIGLIFEDGVAVDKNSIDKALKTIPPFIDKITKKMEPHSAELIVRNKSDLPGSNHQIHVCNDLPSFLHHIQLFNDGHKSTSVRGSRGTIADSYTESDLSVVLKKKHKALNGYQKCDQYWLVIASGSVPPIHFKPQPPSVMLPTQASYFGNLDLSLPIQSDFDRVYFFKSPTDATLLTPTGV